tara:strand:+ start:5781 stop:6437 length:657 start_codon:yes stop_codon:yes gene_type:complete
MKTPTVSVIIPVFNQEKWIGRCIRSLLDQTMNRSNYEIIIIDDGSEDRSGFAFELFMDEIVLLKNEKNSGLPAALNKGIKASKGNHIVRLDGDDYVNKDFLFLLHEFLEQNKYMDAIACDYLLVDDDENVISRENCIENPIGCGIMFKSVHLFELGFYDEEFKMWEERDLRYRFEKKYKIHRLELPLYRYRRHEKNITNNRDISELHKQKLKLKHGIK